MRMLLEVVLRSRGQNWNDEWVSTTIFLKQGAGELLILAIIAALLCPSMIPIALEWSIECPGLPPKL